MTIDSHTMNGNGAHSAVFLAIISASLFSLGTSANASTQDNRNQEVLLLPPATDVVAHAWHTGDPKKLVFQGKQVSMENPGGDPDFLVDGNKIYVYTSTDANQRVYQTEGDINQFGETDGIMNDTYLNMDGYTVWSSEDMVHWTNHGVQFAAANMNERKWAEASNTPLNMNTDTTLQLEVSPHAMWAPSAAKYTDGTNTTYVLYYPKGIDGTTMFATGYATAPTPVGPFTDQGPIYGDIGDNRFVIGMDPNVFQDDDGKIYIYGNGITDSSAPGGVVVAQLSEFDHINKTQYLITEPVSVNYDMNNTMYDGLVGDVFEDTDFHEGGSMHKSNGKYYLSWAEHYHKHYNGWYAMCSSPMGPCEWMGPTVKGIYYGNQHGSFVEFKGKDYFLTHIDHNQPVKSEWEWDSYRRTWTIYPVTYNADKSLRVMYPDAASIEVPSINIGGTYADESGALYYDSSYISSGGYSVVEEENLQKFVDANPNTTDLELYKAQRFVNAGPLNVSVPVQNGQYTVTLKFAEIFANAAIGTEQNWFRRVMDISAEGTPVKIGLNVFDVAGHYSAHDETFTVNVTDGSLDIEIIATSDSPMLNAVKISKQADWAINTGGGREAVGSTIYDADPGVGDFNDNTSENITLDAKQVIGASSDEQILFQTTRIGWAGLGYSNSSLANGNYKVTLGFAETHHNESGLRLFDVEIEDKLVLDDFDIHEAAGGRNVAVKRVFPVTLTDGELNIDLTTVKDASKISFIKVVRLPDDVADSSIRINAGLFWGDNNTEGANFLSDDQFLDGAANAGSTRSAITREDLTHTGMQTVTPSDEAVYQSERWASNINYKIPVRDGRYRVRLMFAEQFHSAPGKREFTISLEGSVVEVAPGETVLDIYRAAGGKNKAIDRFYEVEVVDQELNIDFNAITNNASITGIVVTPRYLKKNATTPSDPAIWEAGYRDDQL
ncbi:MAG: malectin domain-containing carbohydrate-binding protein [Granulosicoccus sp.]